MEPSRGDSGQTHVAVDPDLCIGSGECVRLLPEAFELDESRGVSVALPAARSADPKSLAKVVRSCPMSAIRVVGRSGELL